MPAANTDDEWQLDPTQIFVTATYYKGQFYDLEVRNYNWRKESDYWSHFLSQVPENILDRATWVAARKMELSLQEPYNFIVSEERIKEPRNNNALIPDRHICKASYVIDLDSEVFTIDGTFHYNLQTFPKNMQQPGRERRHNTTLPDHIGTVSRWKFPTPDFSNTSTEYKSLNAVETPIEDWGIRKQNELCASQVLSLQLVNTLLTDEAEVFSNPDVAGQRSLYSMYCWHLITIAAPGLLDLSMLEESREPRSLCNSEHSSKPTSNSIQSGYFRPNICCSGAKKGTLDMAIHVDTDWNGLYWNLRGCLITFCPRLDTELYEELGVLKMVKKLRSSPSKKTVGIIYSGTQIIAVALEGNYIRRTPVLPVYDIKAITKMEYQTEDAN
ncbi:CHD5 domain protein [Ceratobasidium sp. AG-Ba]|nr:CHD5 domain protein [Ceratobasidium sp. AG-Ba]